MIKLPSKCSVGDKISIKPNKDTQDWIAITDPTEIHNFEDEDKEIQNYLTKIHEKLSHIIKKEIK